MKQLQNGCQYFDQNLTAYAHVLTQRTLCRLFHDAEPTSCTIFFIRHLHYIIQNSPHVSTWKEPSSGNHTKAAQHKTKLANICTQSTSFNRHMAKISIFGCKTPQRNAYILTASLFPVCKLCKTLASLVLWTKIHNEVSSDLYWTQILFGW
jgi:hypothetical protein